MAQDALLKALEDDARAQAEKVVSQAEREAAVIVEAAEAEVESLKSERIKGLEDKLVRERTRKVNSARTRAGAVKLKIRHKLVEEVFDSALEHFKALPREEYSRLVKRLFHEACHGLHCGADEKYVVRVNPADVELVDDERARVEPDEHVSLGVVVIAGDGRVRSENTLRSRLERGRKTLLPMVDKILLG